MKEVSRLASGMSPSLIFLILICSIFVSEALIPLFIGIFPPLPRWGVLMLNTILPSVLILPIIYFFIFRPLTAHIIERSRIEEALRESEDRFCSMAEEVSVIAEIGRIIGSTLEINEVYERFAAEARKLIPFDRIAVNLCNIRENIITIAYVSGADLSNYRQGDSFPLAGTLVEEFLRKRTGQIIQSEKMDEIVSRIPAFSRLVKKGLRSIVGVPLIYNDEAIGVLQFRSKTPDAYTDQDLSLAERIGDQIAGAIANAKLLSDQKQAKEALRESEKRYRELSIVDDLTQLYNSRHFYHQLKMEIDRSDRYGQPLTLLFLDLDDFKLYIDTYGYDERDQVLRRLGQVVSRCLRQTDSAYRYGNEEFTILLPMTASADAAVPTERIRTEFKKETFSPVPGKDVHITVSIGLIQYKPQEEMKAFVHRVEQLMYQGKKNGKDRVCCGLKDTDILLGKSCD